MGILTSKTEPLLSRGCDNSSSGTSTVIGGSVTPNFPMELESEEIRSPTLDNMKQTNDNAAFKQSKILNKASAYSSNLTDLLDMISTNETGSKTVGHSELLLSSPASVEKSFAVEESPKLTFAAGSRFESKSPAESSPTKFPPNAKLRVLCSDLLKFKRSHLTNHTGLVSELKLRITKLESTIRLAEALNKEIDIIVSGDMPETESELKVQNVKLKYFIASSSRAFAQISQQMIDFQEHMQRYFEETSKVNDGMDERLSRVVTALCSNNELNETS